MTTPIVQQLQERALDSKVRVSDLLRLALTAARKLQQSDMDEWLSLELGGYNDDGNFSKIPPYRFVKGKVVAWNPYNGWIPIIIQDAAYAKAVSERPLASSVGELEGLIQESGGTLTIHFAPALRNKLMEGAQIPLEPVLQISDAQVRGALDAVRTKVLDWALELERAGISGDGIQFSEREVEAARQITYNIANVGVLGNVSGNARVSNIQAGRDLNLDKVSSLIDQIDQHIDDFDIADREPISSAVAIVRQELAKTKPDEGVIRGSLKSIKTICEGAIGSLIASGVLATLAGIG